MNCSRCGKKGIRHRLGDKTRDICRACEKADIITEREKHIAEKTAIKALSSKVLGTNDAPSVSDKPTAKLTCRICGSWEASEVMTLPNGDLGFYCAPCFKEYGHMETEYQDD